MRIAVDIDSTLHHYWDIFAAVAKSRFGIDLPYDSQRDWTVGLLRPEQVQTIVGETHSEENILGAAPYPGSVEALTRWASEGHWIHITSHRAADAHDATAKWLEATGFPCDDLHCSYDKITRCVEMDVDLLIDDSPTNIRRALEVGIRPATLLHPWNEDVCAEEGVISAVDWAGLTELLDPILAAGSSTP
jgi:hypothetical protein